MSKICLAIGFWFPAKSDKCSRRYICKKEDEKLGRGITIAYTCHLC